MQIVQCKDRRKKTIFDTKYEKLIFFQGLLQPHGMREI